MRETTAPSVTPKFQVTNQNTLMRTTQVTFFCLLTAATLAIAADQYAIRADVSLVELEATVTDHRGKPIAGLSKDEFQLFVDDNLQPITAFQKDDAPVTAGIVIDNSASMAPKRDAVIAAALDFARASNPEDQMFVVHFNEQARLGLPPGTLFTGNISELEKAVGAFDLGGTTALYDALLLSQSQFQQAAYSRKVLLTITDGGDNSSHATLAAALDGASKAGIVIYSIGIFDQNDRDRNPQVLSTIARQTGGEAFFPERLGDIREICRSTAQAIRNQYTIGFSGAADGQYHRIRLIAKNPKYGQLEVRTREGYRAMQSPSAGI